MQLTLPQITFMPISRVSSGEPTYEKLKNGIIIGD
ncbi:Uncharacterised protein [Vibrio cholerae]|nr:Uncharacterised protein [Vibrio cholerae]